MPEVVFLPAAAREASDAQDWYEREAPGFGVRFREELHRAVQRLADNPLQFPQVVAPMRRALLRRFPYALYFGVVDDSVFVVACIHSSRDPLLWRNRGVGGS